MPRKAKIDIDELTKQKVADGISKGLFNAKVKFNELRLEFNNGQGLVNLNYIFSSLHSIADSTFIVNSFKRGSYKFAVMYDVNSKSLMTLASKATIERLLNRDEIRTCHYIDALLKLNTDFEGDCIQSNFFTLLEEPIPDEKREELCEEIIHAWKSNEIEKYVLIEYDINHSAFTLLNLNTRLYSENFVLVNSQSWFKFIKADYNNEIIDNTPIQDKNTNNTEENNLLNIKLKKTKLTDVG